MVDQSIRFLKGIAKDAMVRIHDQFAIADFMVLDMGEEDNTPIIIGRPFLNTTNTIIYVVSRQSTSNSLEIRYAVILIVIPLMSSRRSPALGGDIDYPKTKRINPQRKAGRKMRNLKKL